MADGQRVGAAGWYTLAILTLIMCINNMDRYVLAILVQPIKADLHLSDAEIGLITGFAFSAFYALFSFPVAQISDRGHRYKVIWISMSVWTVMVALCGAVQNFWQMLFVRFTLGAGEAGASPASQSIIGDLFPPSRRNVALSLFLMGGGSGSVLAFAVGGALEPIVGWRWTFALCALPSIPLLLLYLLTVRDPKPGGGTTKAVEARPTSIRKLLSNPILVNLFLATAFSSFIQLGLPQWLPAFLERSHDMARSQIGATLAMTTSLSSVIGIVSGGFIADRMMARNRLWPARIMLGSVVIAIIPYLLVFTLDRTLFIFPCLTIGAFFIAVPAGIGFATCLSVVSPGERASAASTNIIIVAFLGLGLLPLIVGMLSDWFSPLYGADALRWAALSVVAIAGPLACFHYYRVLALLKRHGAGAELPFSSPAGQDRLSSAATSAPAQHAR